MNYQNKRKTANDISSVTKTLDGSNKHVENNSKYMMISYTYVSRELVSKPGEYKQGARHHNIESHCLEWICVITETLKN